MIAVWATTGPKGQIDRAARPLTGNTLLVTLGSDAAQIAIKNDIIGPAYPRAEISSRRLRKAWRSTTALTAAAKRGSLRLHSACGQLRTKREHCSNEV